MPSPCPTCGDDPVFVQDPETHGPGQHVNATAVILWCRNCNRMLIGRSWTRLDQEWSRPASALDRCDLLTWEQVRQRVGLAQQRGWRFL